MTETWNTLTPEEHKKFLSLLAKQNLRGITSSDIVCEIQRMRADLLYEKDDMQKYLMECRLNHHLNELERRTRLNESGVRTTNKEIIQAIKDKIAIEDVIAWYTDVYTHGKDRWEFKCPLHSDKHPSGKIYLDQQTYWCFQCNTGGDIFNALGDGVIISTPGGSSGYNFSSGGGIISWDLPAYSVRFFNLTRGLRSISIIVKGDTVTKIHSHYGAMIERDGISEDLSPKTLITTKLSSKNAKIVSFEYHGQLERIKRMIKSSRLD